MTAIDPNVVETLLNMSESDVLDFKRDQYPLAGATDDQKSELVKDIVAFANAWKTDDAHIFIGADENAGGRATLTGIAGHLDDADLQQLVNMKTNVPVAFEYIAFTVDGKQAAVIRVKREQQRPIFLKKAFGKLKPNVVYVRRGSSTAEAAPDEVARMGASVVVAQQAPVLDLELAEPEGRNGYGKGVTLSCKVLAERPPPPPISREMEDYISKQFGVARHLQDMVKPFQIAQFRPPGPDPKKLVAYKKEMGLLRPLGFCARNVGRVLVEDVRVVLSVPKSDGIRVVDELPTKPRGAMDLVMPIVARSFTRPTRSSDVSDVGSAFEVVARLGKIQPGATVWSKPFWVGSSVACDLALVARVYGDNISAVIEVPIQIKIETTAAYLEDEDEDVEGADDDE